MNIQHIIVEEDSGVIGCGGNQWLQPRAGFLSLLYRILSEYTGNDNNACIV
jgi:hypothetical protein